jgi:hypothetical protein
VIIDDLKALPLQKYPQSRKRLGSWRSGAGAPFVAVT